jgi:hypothetical protein
MEKFSASSYRYIVNRGHQKTIAAGLRDVAAIGGKIETIGNRRPVDYFRIE